MAITVNLYYIGTIGTAGAFVNEMTSSGTVKLIRKEPAKENMKNELLSVITSLPHLQWISEKQPYSVLNSNGAATLQSYERIIQ